MSIFGARERADSAEYQPHSGVFPIQEARGPMAHVLAPPAGHELVGSMGLDPNFPSPVTHARLAAWLKDNNYSYFVDSDGDLGGLWDNRMFHFLILGDGTAFQIRGQWNRFGNMDRIEDLLNVVNEWNSDRIWPKAYVRVRDDGTIVVCTDLTITADSGLSEPQLDLQLRCGLATSAAFFDSLEVQFPDSIASRK
ncbi:MAG: YbjN domain-containing protein [Cellulomonadaceae bacterium]|nr:YbjN domain-containing protein [Cellulomonadaceae bacterium]